MILRIFRIISTLLSCQRKCSTPKQEESSLDAKFGNTGKFLNSRKQSREVRQGAVINKVLRPYDMDEKSITDHQDISMHIWKYDYMRQFMENNSLEHGGIPLCISPTQVDVIKKTDAVYCHQEDCWFWPFRRNANLNEIYDFLPRAHRFEDETILSPNLVPEPLWGQNLRRYLSSSDWDFLRKFTYSQSGYRCSICGGKGKQWPVECDEVWDYRTLEDGRSVAVLIALRALCPRCHRVNHLGKANVDGKYDETIRHMAYINGWSMAHAEFVANKAFKLFNERSEKFWLMGYDDECSWDPSVEEVLKTFFVRLRLLKASAHKSSATLHSRVFLHFVVGH